MTNAEARFNKSLRPRKPEGSLGRRRDSPATSTSTLTQLLNYDRDSDDDDELMLNVLRCHETY